MLIVIPMVPSKGPFASPVNTRRPNKRRSFSFRNLRDLYFTEAVASPPEARGALPQLPRNYVSFSPTWQHSLGRLNAPFVRDFSVVRHVPDASEGIVRGRWRRDTFSSAQLTPVLQQLALVRFKQNGSLLIFHSSQRGRLAKRPFLRRSSRPTALARLGGAVSLEKGWYANL